MALVLKTKCDQGHQEPSANIIYSWKDDFQACHTGVAKGDAPSMAMYPARPVDLGSNWLSKAYLENSQPLGKDVFIAPWMKKVAVRSTNSLLQSGGTAPKSKGFKSQSSQGNLSTSTDPRLDKLLDKLVEKCVPSEQPQVAFATHSATSQQECMQRPVATPQAAPATKLPENHLPEIQSPEVKPKTSLQAMEEKAFNQLKVPKILKRPASKMSQEGNAAAGSHQAKSDAKAVPKKQLAAKAKASANAKPKPKKASAPKAKPSYGNRLGPGCPKCRGTGCSTCGDPNFTGTVLPGKEPYAAWRGRA